MKIPATQYILGAGSVGHLLAAHQTLAGIKVCLLSRRIKKTIESAVLFQPSKSGIVKLKYQPAADKAAIDTLLVCVKSYQVEEALRVIKPRLKENAKVLILSNGMGHLEMVKKLLGDQIATSGLALGVNTHGAYYSPIPEPMVEHRGSGEIIIGNPFTPKQTKCLWTVEQRFSPAVNFSWSDSITEHLWLKLGVNAVINPLTVIHNCHNGDLLGKANIRTQMDHLITELEHFFELADIALPCTDFRDYCIQVINQTATNSSSMRQDFINNRPLELESITGYLLKVADRVTITLKEHRTIYELLKNS